MSLVAALLPNPVQLTRLRAAMRLRTSVVACADWADLHRACAREPIATVVADLYASGAAAFDDLRQLRRRHPGVARVLYVAQPPARLQDLFEAGRFGLDGLIVMDADDTPATLAAIVERARARGVTEQLRRSLADTKPSVRDAVLLAVTRAHQRLTAAQLARIVGIRPRVLGDRLREAGFPPPQRLITWGRLIVAAQLLEDPERSADSVALSLDFPSGSAFRNSCQRYVRRTPGEIRRAGGARVVIAALLAELRGDSPEGAMRFLTAASATPVGVPVVRDGPRTPVV